jgi:hypothetical protein
MQMLRRHKQPIGLHAYRLPNHHHRALIAQLKAFVPLAMFDFYV